MEENAYDFETLQGIYKRVIEEPNENPLRKACIKCPECGEEILMIPTLRVMNSAIENHIHSHREELKDDPIKEHQKALSIRLALVTQVLHQACGPQVS